MMTVGKQIKYYRKLRGFTQRELAAAVGLSAKKDDVRIAQYEAEIRKPKAERRMQLAKALHISPAALEVPNVDTLVGIMHILFVLERDYGFKIGWHDEELRIGLADVTDKVLRKGLEEWAEQNRKLAQGVLTKEDYLQWEACYF